MEHTSLTNDAKNWCVQFLFFSTFGISPFWLIPSFFLTSRFIHSLQQSLNHRFSFSSNLKTMGAKLWLSFVICFSCGCVFHPASHLFNFPLLQRFLLRFISMFWIVNDSSLGPTCHPTIYHWCRSLICRCHQNRHYFHLSHPYSHFFIVIFSSFSCAQSVIQHQSYLCFRHVNLPLFSSSFLSISLRFLFCRCVVLYIFQLPSSSPSSLPDSGRFFIFFTTHCSLIFFFWKRSSRKILIFKLKQHALLIVGKSINPLHPLPRTVICWLASFHSLFS